ncbi:MAG: hypothetical protein IT454_22000, partial [Planctomycetes bacterium]|nr:hypothetical protein [Planctomycetota bacterium]
MIEEVGWSSLLGSQAPAGSRLKAALLTTYDRPDERFMIEHLLPPLLGIAHDPQGEGVERERFFAEVDGHLRAMRGKIAVIASMPGSQDEASERAYPWLWKYIPLLAVGRHGRATQHAKLWLFHWAAPEGETAEHVEMIVSSANLTRSAFREQIQAAWRCVCPLEPRARRHASWGIVPDFLRALGKSSGATELVETFAETLARAEPPQDVAFVASVPGRHTKQELKRTPWGAAGLGE